MSMAIEKVDYSHLLGRNYLRDGVGELEMVVTYPFEQTVFFTTEEFEAHRTRLDTPPTYLRTFIIGTMTALLDPSLKRLPDKYIDLIETIHEFYEGRDIDSYSCFRRERYGAIGITSEYATVLDRLALDTCHFLTVLPGASNSPGTWKEIAYATKRGIDLVGLFRENDPEMEFRQRIMEATAVHGGKSHLTWITFMGESDLIPQLEVVSFGLAGRIAQ